MKKRSHNFFDPQWMLIFVFFVAGVFSGTVCTYLYINSSNNQTVKLHFPKGTFQYTNPTLVSESVGGTNNTVGKDLELKLRGVIAKAKRNGVQDAGIYYRDLEPAKWLDINSAMQFSPGVLLKIPIMITYFRLAEENRDLLSQQIVFNKLILPDTHQFFSEQPTLESGKSYSVDYLIKKMIVNNDNESSNALFENVDKSILNETFSDLGIDFNEDNTEQDFISIRRYSLFFRVLYSASYLSPEYSEKALGLLAQNSSQTMLQKQLPQSISFVSRSGGRSVSLTGAEIYECDIVYYPNHDYLLCAVATGSNVESIKNLFTDIGIAVYEDTLYRYTE